MLTKRAWYGLVLLRFGVGVAAALGGWAWIWNTAIPLAAKLMLETFLAAVIGGLLILGPVSYSAYLEFVEKVSRSKGGTHQ